MVETGSVQDRQFKTYTLLGLAVAPQFIEGELQEADIERFITETLALPTIQTCERVLGEIADFSVYTTVVLVVTAAGGAQEVGNDILEMKRNGIPNGEVTSKTFIVSDLPITIE